MVCWPERENRAPGPVRNRWSAPGIEGPACRGARRMSARGSSRRPGSRYTPYSSWKERSRAARICCWRWARGGAGGESGRPPRPWRSMSESASWLGTLVERVDISCSRWMRSAWIQATTQPTWKARRQAPLVQEPHSRLSPRASQRLMGLGRCGQNRARRRRRPPPGGNLMGVEQLHQCLLVAIRHGVTERMLHVAHQPAPP